MLFQAIIGGLEDDGAVLPFGGYLDVAATLEFVGNPAREVF
ncbi:MAG: hypothetical protein ACKOE4_07565 [Candidatus Kapaibacterium sp.]